MKKLTWQMGAELFWKLSLYYGEQLKISRQDMIQMASAAAQSGASAWLEGFVDHMGSFPPMPGEYAPEILWRMLLAHEWCQRAANDGAVCPFVLPSQMARQLLLTGWSDRDHWLAVYLGPHSRN